MRYILPHKTTEYRQKESCELILAGLFLYEKERKSENMMKYAEMLKLASHDSNAEFVEIPDVDNACIVVNENEGIMLHMGVPVLFAKGMYAVTMCNLTTIGTKGNLRKAIEFFDNFCVVRTGRDKSRVVNPDWAYITPRNKSVRLLDGNKYECSFESGTRKVDVGNATICFPG